MEIIDNPFYVKIFQLVNKQNSFIVKSTFPIYILTIQNIVFITKLFLSLTEDKVEYGLKNGPLFPKLAIINYSYISLKSQQLISSEMIKIRVTSYFQYNFSLK